MYADQDLIVISSLQHYFFCARQCALIHIEQIWSDNVFTVQGELLHAKAHSEKIESRGNVISEFGIPVRSDMLGITGKVDAVEFHADGKIVIVEYKRGKPKVVQSDEVQLCAQALCLEEMKKTHIERGFLYYAELRHRHEIVFTDALRSTTKEIIASVRSLLDTGITPPPEYKKACKSCSLFEYCMPEKMEKRRIRVAQFLKKHIAKDDADRETNA